MAIKVRSVSQTPVIHAHALRIRQGDRDVYHFGLRMRQFDDALPVEVDAKVIRDNRPFIPTHAEAIVDYLEHEGSWLLGPVSLSIDPGFIEFEPYPGQEKDIPEIGELRIVEGAGASLRIIDGQHRRWAIREYRKRSSTSDPQRKAFDASQMPVALYGETDPKRIHQMFADMARSRNMTAIVKARFDHRDPFNRAAESVMNQSDWLRDFVELDRSTVARSSAKLVAFNQLAVNLKSLLFGYGGRASQLRTREVDQQFDDLVKLGLTWTDDFLPSARNEYRLLLNLEEDDDYLPRMRKKTFAYSGTMLRILAGCFYEWGKRRPDEGTGPLKSYISAMDFRTNQRNSLLFQSGVVDNEGYTLRGGRREIGFAIDSIVSGAEQS